VQVPILGRVNAIWCPEALFSNPEFCQASADPRTFGLAIIPTSSAEADAMPKVSARGRIPPFIAMKCCAPRTSARRQGDVLHPSSVSPAPVRLSHQRRGALSAEQLGYTGR
jgi:hypothetical protein